MPTDKAGEGRGPVFIRAIPRLLGRACRRNDDVPGVDLWRLSNEKVRDPCRSSERTFAWVVAADLMLRIPSAFTMGFSCKHEESVFGPQRYQGAKVTVPVV